MAKRFGRNQRRQMREQVAQLTMSRDIHVQRVVEAQGRARQLQHAVRELIDELPENSALLDPLLEEVVRDWPPQVNRREWVEKRGGRRRVVGDFAMVSPDAAMQLVDLMTYQLQADPDIISQRIRFKVVHDKGPGSAYAVDLDYVRLHGFSERMVQEMAIKIARDLGAHVGKSLRG